jgi:hypothetical protein
MERIGMDYGSKHSWFDLVILSLADTSNEISLEVNEN